MKSFGLKLTSKSGRSPDTMHFNNTFCNKPYKKADLFNNYFYEQLSCPSHYNTHISWSNDFKAFDIDFNRNRFHKLLSNINSNKTSGPDDIHGKVFLKCFKCLAYPLSLIQFF